MGDAAKPLHCVDGWYTEDAEEFQFYMRDPKTWTYAAQLGNDVRSWKTWLLWLCGLAWPIAGAATRSPPLLAIGIFPFTAVVYVYVHMLRRVVRSHRASVLIEGVVERFDTPHPLLRSRVAGELKQDVVTDRKVWALLPARIVTAHARPSGSLQVLVSYSADADFNPVVAFRLS
jgi:hypothetical protein